MREKTFQQLFEEMNQVPFDFFEEDNSFLTEELDHEILMHRDAHFGGDFALMLQYYENPDHLGIHPDYPYERIQYLQRVEKETGNNLAPLLLTAAEMEKVARCLFAYQKFKELYEQKEGPAHLIADLVLTEVEEPIEELEAVIKEGAKLLPQLLAIVESEEGYDALFPGYGFAPYLAIVALGKIGTPSALPALFHVFRRETLFDEAVLLDAFIDIGEPAKQFLLEQLTSRPLTQNAQHAAFALSAFHTDKEVALTALKQLQDPLVAKNQMLCNYLLCLCDILEHTPSKTSFLQLLESPFLSEDSKRQIRDIVQNWQ